jgi:hypothetical protein
MRAAGPADLTELRRKAKAPAASTPMQRGCGERAAGDRELRHRRDPVADPLRSAGEERRPPENSSPVRPHNRPWIHPLR